MKIETAAAGKTALPAFRVLFLCVFSLLLLMLSAVPPAAGETASLTWEQRLEAARLKYNEDTVNVYRRGYGSPVFRKFNVRFYPSLNRDPDNKPYININIPDSLRITDEAEIQAILEVIARSKYYDEEYYGPVSFMKAQWVTHNLAHSMATGSPQQQWLVQAVAGESLKEILTSAEELDLSPYGNITEKQRTVYDLVELTLQFSGR